ncbi:MAG: hypothetical protein ACP5GJ_01375 [Nanopusillaceae archaeon]|jgi:hypothetical protein
MRYSLLIRIEKKVSIDGNPDILWYINQLVKNTNDLENILEALRLYKQKFRKKNKMNIVIVGDIDKNIMEKYKDDFNIIIQKDVQENITKFIDKNK